MMSLPGGHGTMTHLAWRLPSQQLRCQRGSASSPLQEGIADLLVLVHYPMYSYAEHRLQEPHNVHRHIVT